MKLYEAMFVVNYNAAKESFEKVEAECFSCITRHGGEVVNSIKWDDRRLAYEIKKQKRATYILVHFKAPGESVSRIERQCKLSEDILRVLITVDEDGEEVSTFTPVRDERHEQNPKNDSDKNDDSEKSASEDSAEKSDDSDDGNEESAEEEVEADAETKAEA